MKSLRFLDRRTGFSLASIGMLLGIVAPAALPAFASAGTLTTRSIQMSDSSQGATSVDYKLTFTPETTVGATGGLFVDFCTDTPLIVNTCTAPTGLDTTGLSADTGTVTSAAANSIKLVTALTAATPFTVTFSGIDNPDDSVKTFYARIMTYADTTALSGHTSTTVQGTYIDNGSVALSATGQIGVTAYVLESMTFCVSGDSTGQLTGDCGTDDPGGGASGASSPSMTLGETTGSVTALQANAVSHKGVYTQLSSNAAGGVAVNLKSDASTCGGLFRNGVHANCEIAPQTTAAGTITAGNALFGVKVSDPVDAPGAANASGNADISQDGNYSADNYFMDYVSGDGSGVTSTYGSPLFHATGPVNNQDVNLTFGASISNSTPAGQYGANLNLIATGTF